MPEYETAVEQQKVRTQPETGNTRLQLILGACALTVLTLAFLMLFWNRFLALRTGHGSLLLAQLLLEGRIPHRDYFLAVPPLHYLKTAAFVHLFGSELIIPHVLALLERGALALVIYFWMARYLRASDALLASLLAMTVACGDTADMLTSYNHATILYAVAAGYVTCLYLDSRTLRAAAALASLAGVLTGISFGTKQTVGLGVMLALPFIVFLLTLRNGGIRRSGEFLFFFGVGWGIPMAALYTWLYRAGALRQHFDQVFFSGVAGKGSLFDLLFRRAVVLLFGLPLFLYFFTAVNALFWYYVACKRWPRPERISKDTRPRLFWFSALAGLSILAGAVLGLSGLDKSGLIRLCLLRSTIYVTLMVTAALCIRYALASWRGRLTREEEHFWVISGVSFAIAYMLSLSWPAFEAMLLPGLAFVAGLALRRLGEARVPRRALLFVFCVLIYSETLFKLEIPFAWGGWIEAPVRTANVESKLPPLKGFRLPRESVFVAERVTEIIQAHSAPKDTIFIYPGLSVFYVLSGRRSPAFSYDHGIDVAPDRLAIADAKRLLDARPAVMVLYVPAGAEPGKILEWGERQWRDGRPSGQREILSAIEQLSAEYKFHETVTARAANVRLEIWARN